MAYIRRFACIGHADEPSAADLRFPVADYPVETEPSVFEKRRMAGGRMRETLRLTLRGAAEDIRDAFSDGVRWYLQTVCTEAETDMAGASEAGIPAAEHAAAEDTDAAENTAEAAEMTRIYDQSGFCIAGDVVDHRNGCVTIYMAKKTAEELAIEALEAENARLLFEHLTGGTY